MAINRSSTSSTQGSSTSTLGGRQPQRVSSYRLPHDVLRKYLQRTYPGQYKLEVRSATYPYYSAWAGLSLTMLRKAKKSLRLTLARQETLEALMEEE
ncbi:hypothetical protein LTR93_010225 [Exophiala xenobiotica]|nr:hypothetical protein LTR93_010225 [Exophiala xenobiotica]